MQTNKIYYISLRYATHGKFAILSIKHIKTFFNTGVDYAGPIDIRVSKGRGNKSYKGYISLFVCLATRAIHLEVVSDQSSEAFLCALKRFIGLCQNIYSDNGTNFVGADKILAKDIQKAAFNNKIAEVLANDGIKWHFIPPASPHMGGIWEAGVKSMKYHMKRILGNSTLTFEEMTTVCCQIEACLNSRPICSMSNDPDDMTVLTPGHFLVGTSLITPPEPNLLDVKINCLSRWQLLIKMKQDFWQIWSSEYLSRLQQRPKWCSNNLNIEIGNLVLIKGENLPPSKWALGRVMETHPGADNLVRVVSVKTQNGILKRPIRKLCLLPIIDNEETD